MKNDYQKIDAPKKQMTSQTKVTALSKNNTYTMMILYTVILLPIIYSIWHLS